MQNFDKDFRNFKALFYVSWAVSLILGIAIVAAIIYLVFRLA